LIGAASLVMRLSRFGWPSPEAGPSRPDGVSQETSRGRNLVVTLRSTDEHKRSLGEIEVEFVPYLAAELLKSLSQACVQSGLANQAADLLKEAGVEERMLPLYEALRAAAAGPGASLAHLAPEVRVPAEELLKFLLEPTPPPEAPP